MQALLFLLLITVFSISHGQPPTVTETATEKTTEHWRIGAIEQYPLNGMGAQILSDAYQRAGLTFELSQWPSPRSLQLASQGELDGELGRIENIAATYPHLLKVPVPLLTFEIVAVTADPDLAHTAHSVLSQYRLGISPGMALYEQINLPTDEAFQPSTAQQLLRMTQARRVDFALIPALLAHEWQQSSSKPLYILPGNLATFRIYHFIHDKHADRLDALTQSLQQLRDSGELERIQREYFRQQMLF